MTSYLFQSDVIGMPFCQGTKHNSCLLPSCYGNRSMSSSHYDLRGASHTVYAMLLSNYGEILPEINTMDKCVFLKSMIHSQ